MQHVGVEHFWDIMCMYRRPRLHLFIHVQCTCYVRSLVCYWLWHFRCSLLCVR